MREWVDFRVVKQTVSLEAVLRLYQVPGRRRRRDQLEGRCPIHRGEREDSFRANLSKNAFHCFGCQAGGNVLDFVAAMERCSVREAALRLQQCFHASASAGSSLPSSTRAASWKGELVRKKETGNPPLGFALTGVDHGHPYLAQRGIDGATASQFGVGYYAGPGLLSGRIVIPIQNRNGAIVAYAGRTLKGELPKYRLPAGFQKGLELFNVHRALATGNKTVIVVEGYFDCMQVYQAGLPFVVALMGSCLSLQQERILLQCCERVILMLDGDQAGWVASEAIGARLSKQCSVVLAHVPEGTQPDQLSSTTIRQLIGDLERVKNLSAS